MRNGYLPFIDDNFSQSALEQSKLFIVISPAKTFSDSEIQQIDHYLKRGGRVIWSVDFEEKESSENFLKKYGLDLDNIPLGPVSKDQTEPGLQFYEAWPVVWNEKDTVEVLCQAWDFPVIVSRKIGLGELIVIGDSGFLLSENLEGESKYHEENILYLKSLLKGLRRKTALK